jgi:osmotically-inducible protein OsmY
MIQPAELIRTLQAGLEIDPRIQHHRHPVRVTLNDGAVLLEGEVPSIAAKRVAARLARERAGEDYTVVDAMKVVPPAARSDGEMLDALTRSLLAVPELRHCAMRRRHRDDVETLRRVDNGVACGDLQFGVSGGVVELDGRVESLSHRRLIEALAWWTRGCRNVVDRLRIEPPEEDSDAELADAVRLVLEVDPSLPEAGQVGVSAVMGVVTLSGAVHDDAQKRRVEHDLWLVE